MAKRSQEAKTNGSEAKTTQSSPAFPYSTKPNSLRKFLAMVPNKPRPSRVVPDTVTAWGLKDSNDATIIRVLKALGMVSQNNEPTDMWSDFMSPEKGPAVLAGAIRRVWAPIFEHSHEPHKEPDDVIKRYFHIHSGGSDTTFSHQIQTFKAACDHADFKSAAIATAGHKNQVSIYESTRKPDPLGTAPTIHIDLHIHLPENKSRRDYESMFEDIARHLLGREVTGGGNGES